jgi:glycosyltransferase involved in cell wall biosynthesis
MTVSILVPVYNAASWIESTLQSCLAQTGDFKLEIIVVDDNSTDNTIEAINRFAAKHPYLNLVFAINPKKGACSARNHAFHMSTGEVIQWLDADDLLGEHKIARQIKLLSANPNCLVASKWRRFTGDLQNLWPEEKGPWIHVSKKATPLEWLLSERMMITSGWLGTRRLFEAIGPWNESLMINQDGEFFTRAIAASEGVVFESESQVYYRTEAKSRVSRFTPDKAPSLFDSLKSFEDVLCKLGNSKEIRILISKKYLGFIQQVCPNSPELIAQAEGKIRQFTPPHFRFHIANNSISGLIVMYIGSRAWLTMKTLQHRVLNVKNENP